MACQHFPDDQTLRLQTGAGEDDFIHLPRSPDHGACECQEEEEEEEESLYSNFPPPRWSSSKASDLRVVDPGSYLDFPVSYFSWLSHGSDLKTDSSVTTLPGS